MMTEAEKKQQEQKKFSEMLNRSLVPLVYSYQIIKKAAKGIKISAPLVYNEVEAFIKKNIVTLGSNKNILKKKDLADIGDTIANSVIRSMPANIDDEELKNLVKNYQSQSFIDMITKSLSMIGRKDYSELPKKKKFRKILIANRGEIALRVIRACRELGIKTVLVYTNPDKDTLAVKYADEVHCIGDKVSYLDFNKIMKIAIETESEAIHPGYGFLAENPQFAKLCEKNKIKFIGPSARTIELLGDKVMAKKMCAKENIPLVEGTQNPLKDVNQAIKMAIKFGYPIILKAAAGGGGKGMRVVWKEGDMQDAFESAQAEAYISFKEKSLYMEKYVEDPRHIEFQILADQHGNIVHLGERDCSVQRKHQKLVEEAPSPALDQGLREKMGDAAVRICKAAKYEGAGTVEFLLDKNKNFFFIEINTRIQVEHGVTEMVTRVDLVKEQLKLASGAALRFSQHDVKIEGWAIECRINAEDPLENFAPSIGTITHYFPPGGPGIRVNSAGYTGYKIHPHYDSLISLLICFGNTRKEAINRMRRALREYTINGVKTTIPFHLAVLHNRDFVKGNVTTSFIEQQNILEKLHDYVAEDTKELAEQEKLLIVNTVVSKFRENKQRQRKQTSAWAQAARQEMAGFNEP